MKCLLSHAILRLDFQSALPMLQNLILYGIEIPKPELDKLITNNMSIKVKV